MQGKMYLESVGRKFIPVFILLVLLWTFSLSVRAQSSRTPNTDFTAQIKHSSTKERGKIYLQWIDRLTREQHPDSARKVVSLALDFARRQKDTDLLKQLYYKWGDVEYYSNHYADANQKYVTAQHFALRAGDTATYIDLLVDRGYIFDYWQKTDSLLKLLNRALDLSQQTGYLKGTARASLAIGNVYYGMNQYRKALQFYRKTLELARRIRNRRGTAISLVNIGMTYMYLDDYESAEKNLKEAIDLLQRLPGAQIQTANAYADLAILYAKKGEARRSEKNWIKALKLYKEYGTDEDKAIGYNEVSECLADLGNYPLSNRYLDSAIALAQKGHFGLMLQKSYLAYAKNLRKMHWPDKAFDYLERYVQIKDSIQSEKYHKQLAEFEAKYHILEKQRRIEQLEHKQKLDKIHNQIILSSSAFLLVLLLITGYFTVQKRRKQAQIAALEMEKMRLKTESLSQQLALKNKQLTAHALNMMQKNKVLTDILKVVNAIMEKVEGRPRTELQSLRNKIKRLISSEKDWEHFKTYFQQVNKDFLDRLYRINPDLTTNDIRLATLMRLNLTNKEIASILNITYPSVKNAQTRLKTKLGLGSEQNLRRFLLDL